MIATPPAIAMNQSHTALPPRSPSPQITQGGPRACRVMRRRINPHYRRRTLGGSTRRARYATRHRARASRKKHLLLLPFDKEEKQEMLSPRACLFLYYLPNAFPVACRIRCGSRLKNMHNAIVAARIAPPSPQTGCQKKRRGAPTPFYHARRNPEDWRGV